MSIVISSYLYFDSYSLCVFLSLLPFFSALADFSSCINLKRPALWSFLAEPAIMYVPSPSENQHSLLTSFDLVQLCLPFTSVLAQIWLVKCCETISHFLVTPIGPIGPVTTCDNLWPLQESGRFPRCTSSLSLSSSIWTRLPKHVCNICAMCVQKICNMYDWNLIKCH